jgi:hypothetical protein
VSKANPETPPNPNPQPTFDYQKWVHDINREEAHRAHDKLDDFHAYVNKGAVKTGQSALKLSMLINGGAAVALLTFIGKLPKEQQHAVADTLVWFASGVALAVAAIAASYFTDYFMAAIAVSRMRTYEHPYVTDGPKTNRFRKLNLAFHILAVGAGLASLGAFVCGTFDVRAALAHLV